MITCTICNQKFSPQDISGLFIYCFCFACSHLIIRTMENCFPNELNEAVNILKLSSKNPFMKNEQPKE